MSASDPFQRDSQTSAGLSINLSSNNPFRNRAASPASPFDDPPSRPVSRNPFLDQSQQPVTSPGAMSGTSDHKSLSAEEIFASLTLDDKKAAKNKNNSAPVPPRQPPPGKRMGENVPPSGDAGNRQHRPTRSQEEALRAKKMQAAAAKPGPSGSPTRKPPPQRRARRNSDSSVLDFDSMPLTEEEKRMIARRRERERSRREGGRPEGESREPREKKEGRDKREGREAREGRDGKDGKPRSKSGRPSRRIDVIDQLDATGIYGTGSFHHDGPFDALNPHRNRNTSRRAPMQAFPKDSLNNSLGGAGPLNKQADHSTFMGQANEEAFREYSYTKKANGEPIFDPIARGDIIHGDESVGLGTSTFLEGTPAARAAIVRNRVEQAQEFAEGGLQRKKSLAQRIRHINKGQRSDSAGRVLSPDGMGPATAGPGEGTPFFAEYGKGEESISVRPRDGAMSPNSPPRRGSGGQLERRATAEGTVSEEGSRPSGLLGRMKSFKGPRKPRNPDGASTSPPGNTGTAI